MLTHDFNSSGGYQQENFAEYEEERFCSSGDYRTNAPCMPMPPSNPCPPASAYRVMEEEDSYMRKEEVNMGGGYNKHYNEGNFRSQNHQKHGYDAGFGGHNKHHNGKPDRSSHGSFSAMQSGGYGYGPNYGGQFPKKHHEKVEYWGMKDVKD